jgi:Zn-dependent peptidase ImmA (M78 family)
VHLVIKKTTPLFLDRYLDKKVNDAVLERFAKQFAVSREVILRKFLDNQKIKTDF